MGGLRLCVAFHSSYLDCFIDRFFCWALTCCVQAQNVYPLPPELAPSSEEGYAYLDIVPTSEGYKHIALFTSLSSDLGANKSQPIWITSGEWEVSGGMLGIDAQRRLV